MKLNKYVDWKVYSVTNIKNKFGFRIILILDDKSKIIQQKSGFDTKSMANKERNKVIVELTNGNYTINKNILLEDFLEYWLEQIMKPNITNASYVTYANAIRKHIIPTLGKSNVVMVNPQNIKHLYNKVATYSYSIVKIVKTIMQTSLDFAEHKKLLAVNPAKYVNLPRCIKTKNLYNQIKPNKTLTLEQIKILIKASKSTPIYLQILFAVLMGIRKSEINGLKYEDIDYANRKLKVNRQLGIIPNTKKENFAPKTYTKQEIGLKTRASYRELDIPDILFEAILEKRKEYERAKNRWKNCFQDMGYICCSMYGRTRSKDYNFKHFKKILKENNLPNIRWHDLRHTYGTLLIKSNFDIKDVSQLLGHTEETITADIYLDKRQIVLDCLEDIEPFIEEIVPDDNIIDCTDVETDIIMDTYMKEILAI